MDVTPVQLIPGNKAIQGWAAGTPADSEDTLRFADLSGVRGHDRNLSTGKGCRDLRTNYERQGAVPRCFDNVMIRRQVLSVLDGDLNRTWCEEDELGTKPWGHSYQVRERLSFHLSHHLASVCLYRDLADG